MRSTQSLLAALVIAAVIGLLGHGRGGVAAEPEKTTESAHPLVGTWKLVSAEYNGQKQEAAEGETMLKHVTPSHFTWLRYDADGTVYSAAGGRCAIEGDQYRETPSYGMGDSFEQIRDETFTFKWKVEDDQWHHSGNLGGFKIEEVWERVKPK